jgi:Holliday junction resolvase RusA-like endonuclease
MPEIKVEPLSVNQAWQGRRYKTKLYQQYERIMLAALPNLSIPNGPLSVSLTFGFSNRASDLDNPVKPMLDILQKRYHFDDSRIYLLSVNKKIVPKGQESVTFEINTLND